MNSEKNILQHRFRPLNTAKVLFSLFTNPLLDQQYDKAPFAFIFIWLWMQIIYHKFFTRSQSHRLMVSYLLAILSERKLRVLYSGSVNFKTSYIHELKRQQLNIFHDLSAQLYKLGYIQEPPPVEFSHLVMTIASSMRDHTSEAKCALRDNSKELLSALHCIKDYLADKKLARWLRIEKNSPAIADLMSTFIQSYQIFSQMQGITESHLSKTSNDEISAAQNILGQKSASSIKADPKTRHKNPE